MKVNELGLVRVKIVQPGVEMHMVGQVAGFAPHIAQSLVTRGFAVEYTDQMLREDQKRAADIAENGDYRYSDTSPLKNPGFGAPGTQTGHNVADLEQAGMVRTAAGVVNADASVSVRSVGDMTDSPNVPVKEGGSLGGRQPAQQQNGDSTVIQGADGEPVEIPSRWEDQHHAKIMSMGRRISGKDDINTEEAKEVIAKALKDQQSNGDE